MKKKIFTIVACLLLTSSLLFANRNSLCFSRRCDKCYHNFFVKKMSYVSIGVATRRFEIKHRDIDGKKYTCYKCQFGHTLWICLEDGSWYNPETK